MIIHAFGVFPEYIEDTDSRVYWWADTACGDTQVSEVLEGTVTNKFGAYPSIVVVTQNARSLSENGLSLIDGVLDPTPVRKPPAKTNKLLKTSQPRRRAIRDPYAVALTYLRRNGFPTYRGDTDHVVLLPWDGSDAHYRLLEFAAEVAMVLDPNDHFAELRIVQDPAVSR